MTKRPLHHISGNGVISFVIEGSPHNVQPDFPTYFLIREAIKNGEWDKVLPLIDVRKGVSNVTGGRLEIIDNSTVKYDGAVLHNAMSDRLLEMVSGGFPLGSFFRFVENVMENPSRTAVEELYLFLHKNDIPITEDGCILCYKKVDSNLRSIHPSPDGTHLDHAIGKTVTMPRNQVDEDRTNTCSYGLHCCSRSYLPNYGGCSDNRIVIVKVHPKDIVTIPNAKMRACQYLVVKEHKAGQDHSAFTRPVYSADGVAPAERNEDLAKTGSRVRELVDSFHRRNVTGLFAGLSSTALNLRESFLYNGIQQGQLPDLMLEIEEEFGLDVPDNEFSYITAHAPVRALISLYEGLILKKGLSIT